MRNSISESERQHFDSEAISIARFPLIVLVVFLHAFNSEVHFSMPSDYTHLSDVDVYNLIRSTCSYVASLAVPTFFLISGYLFFKKLERWDWQIWLRKIKSRCKTIVAPYFLWCLLYVLWRFYVLDSLKNASGHSFGDVVAQWQSVDVSWFHVLWDSVQWGGGNLNWLGGHVAHTTAPELFPFWFLRNLIVLVAFTPLIYWMLKKLGGWFVLLMGVVVVSGIWPDIHGLDAMSIFYFSLGGWFTLFPKTLCPVIFRFQWAYYIPFLLLLLLFSYFDGQQSFQTYGTKNILVFFGVMSLISSFYHLACHCGWKKNDFLIGSCFFVYAFHAFIQNSCGRVLEWLFGSGSLLSLTIVYFGKVIIPVAICLLLFFCLHRYMPRLCNVLTGGR